MAVSYYFTLFKRFESLGHRGDGPPAYHGQTGGFMSVEFRDADKLYTSKRNNVFLIGTTPGMPTDIPAGDTPLWMVLNAKAAGSGGFTFSGLNWQPMPFSSLGDTGWADIGGQPLVDAFRGWLNAGKPNDYPRFIQLPGAAAPGGETPGGSVAATTGGGPIVFVCSSATDDGTRPGSVPSDFWAHSLVYLADPTSGNEAVPSTLHRTDEFNLVAVVGNRGDRGGKYRNGPGSTATPQIQAQGWVMVFGTGGASPGVQLRSLSKLSYAGSMASDGVWDQYFMDSGSYDIVGFRLNVQEAFNGVVAAINDAVSHGTFTLPMGVTAEQYVEQSPSHLCAKVVARRDDQAWPANDASPLTEPRIAQKNLVRFDVDLGATAGPPSYFWKYFAMGSPLAALIRTLHLADHELGLNTLVLHTELGEGARVMLALPRETFTKWVRKGAVQGYEIVERDSREKWHVPFVDHVVLRLKAAKNGIRIPYMDDHTLAMAIGVEIDRGKMKPDTVRRVTVEHRATIPVLTEKSRCWDVRDAVVGGFTLEFRFTRQLPPHKHGPPKKATGRRNK